jgi:hypothetical protein
MGLLPNALAQWYRSVFDTQTVKERALIRGSVSQ